MKHILLIFLVLFLLFLKKKNVKENFNYSHNETLFNLIDKIYVINMDKDKERMSILDKKLKKMGIEYERISGIDGKKKYKELKDKTKIRPGQLGCLMSHIKILEKAKNNNYQNILIFEDDVIFCKNFIEKLVKLLKKVKQNEGNFDVLYLGCSQKHEWKNIVEKENYYLGKNMDGTFGMIVNRGIFNKTLKNAYELVLPIDRVYSEKIQILNKCFCANPSLITVDINQFSNTVGKVFLNNSYYEKNRINIKDFEI
jgi:glycosyl transferase, family 25